MKLIIPQLEPCEYPWWAASGHLQTILGRYLPSPLIARAWQALTIALTDGDRLTGLYWPTAGSDKILYLFHGLGGEADSAYMIRAADLAIARGFSVALVNHRGAGSGAGLAAKPYHFGSSRDLGQVMQFGRAHFKARLHLALGFSLSGSALLNLVSADADPATKPDAAIVVNAPLRLKPAVENLRRGFNRLYDLKFVGDLRHAIRTRQQAQLINVDYFPSRFTTLEQVDRNFTAVHAGFADADDYYAQASPHPRLEHITTPTIVLTAQDDPVVDYRDYVSAIWSDSATVHIEPRGGHMGYLSSRTTPHGHKRWLSYALGEFLRVAETSLRK